MGASKKKNASKPRDEAAAAAVTSFLLAQEARLAGIRPSVAVLALFGGPGSGKSTLLDEVARELGLAPLVTSASRHAGSFEGESVERFDADLKAATELGRRNGRIGCLIVNDIDQGVVADGKGRQGTQNAGLLIGRMQHYADDVLAGRANPPCALMVSGNDPRHFPPSLARDGRWRFVIMRSSWRLRRRQLLALVGSDTRARLAVEAVMLRYPSKPIAFLAQAASEAREARLIEMFEASGRDIDKFRLALTASAASPLTAVGLWRAASLAASARAAAMRRA